MTISRNRVRVLTGLILIYLTGFAPFALARGSVAPVVAPVGETKAFRGTLRAMDLRLGTVSLGSRTRITRILAIDRASRLYKGIHPATLADFALGDVVEGFAFPDPYGRTVIAVATAQARPLSAQDAPATKVKKPRQPRASASRSRRPKVGPEPTGGSPAIAPNSPRVAPLPAPVRRADNAPPAVHLKRRSARIHP